MGNKDEIVELLQEQNKKFDEISNILNDMVAIFFINSAILVFLFMVFISILIHL